MKRIIITLAALLASAISAVSQQVFPIRGINLDFRTQVMTMDALKQTVLKASGEGINTLLIEWEGSLPFEHNASLSNRYAFSKQEIKDFVAYCNSLGVDVIPLQNCFGHCEYILSQPRYSHLREERNQTSQVCPLKEDQCAKVFESIFKDVVELHTSKYIHIGADETRLLGHCPKCAAKVAKEGVSALYVDYLNRMCEIVHSLGKTPVIWADMILKHPEAAGKLPKDLVILDWNYGWKPDKFGDIENITKLGFEVWGAPSLRSSPDNIFLTQWAKHFDNLEVYSKYALEHGYKGFIETSWSTSGVYGTIMDDGYDIYALQPMREVYPLRAFDPLQRAFGKVVNNPSATFDKDAFLADYAASHFGITSDNDRKVFVSYFNMPQNQVIGARFKESTIEKDLRECMNTRNAFASLKPRMNKEDFEHLVLMLDIRANYLQFMLWRCRYEDPAYTRASASELAKGISDVLKDGKKLQKKFIALNKSYLKDPAASYGSYSYLAAAENLLAILKNSPR